MKSLPRLLLLGCLPFTAPAFAFAPPPGGQGQSDPFSQMLPLLFIFMGIIYFIIIRPQQKEQKRHKLQLEALKKGDRIITAGGIHGTVRSTKDKTLVLEVAEGVKVTLNKASVSTVLESGAEE